MPNASNAEAIAPQTHGNHRDGTGRPPKYIRPTPPHTPHHNPQAHAQRQHHHRHHHRHHDHYHHHRVKRLHSDVSEGTKAADAGPRVPPELESAVLSVSAQAPVEVQAMLYVVVEFLMANFLNLGMVVITVFALTCPGPGRAVASVRVGDDTIGFVQAMNHAAIFFISGISITTKDFRNLVTHWGGLLYGLLAILFGTTVVGLAAKRLPLQPPPFAMGLAILWVMPTTLGVGNALTQLAHGNKAMALLLTVLTNILSVFTIPLLLPLLLNDELNANVRPLELTFKLLLTVFIPVLAGMLLRRHGRVRSWVRAHGLALDVLSSCNLLCIIWQQLSHARDILVLQRPLRIVLVLLAAACLHMATLSVNTLLCFVLQIPRPEAAAVILMSSQKSATVAVAVISYIVPSNQLALQGLLSVPCILSKLVQTFICSALAPHMSTWVDGYKSTGTQPSSSEGSPSPSRSSVTPHVTAESLHPDRVPHDEHSLRPEHVHLHDGASALSVSSTPSSAHRGAGSCEAQNELSCAPGGRRQQQRRQRPHAVDRKRGEWGCNDEEGDVEMGRSTYHQRQQQQQQQQQHRSTPPPPQQQQQQQQQRHLQQQQE